MSHTISLTSEDLADCIQFSQEVVQSTKQFGSRSLRSSDEQVADTLVGKLGELALQRSLETRFDYVIAVDFAHYEAELVTDDGQDIALVQDQRWLKTSYRVDCKANTGNAQWLLVEEHKFWADAYVMVRLGTCPAIGVLRRDLQAIEQWDLTAEICGFCYDGDLFETGVRDEGRPWFDYREGRRLLSTRCVPGTPPTDRDELERMVRTSPYLAYIGPSLDAPRNFGLPIGWLRVADNDWRQLLKLVSEDLSAPGAEFRQKFLVDRKGRVRNQT